MCHFQWNHGLVQNPVKLIVSTHFTSFSKPLMCLACHFLYTTKDLTQKQALALPKENGFLLVPDHHRHLHLGWFGWGCGPGVTEWGKFLEITEGSLCIIHLIHEPF